MFQTIRLKPRRNQSETWKCGAVEELESRRLLSAGQLGMQPNLIEGLSGSFASEVSQSTQISERAPTKADRTDALKELHAIGNSAGPGQTIVIVSAFDDPNISSDLNVFDAEFGLPDAEITQVGQTGLSPASYGVNAAWALETSLDVEWAHAIAPAANILLVDSQNADLNNLLAAADYAQNRPNVVAISKSWSSSEFQGQTNLDFDFSAPAADEGETSVAPAGDNGSTSVPFFQHASHSSATQSVPDVDYAAAADTGLPVYDSIRYQGAVGWQEIGGTSGETPQWAALATMADQIRQAGGDNDGSDAADHSSTPRHSGRSHRGRSIDALVAKAASEIGLSVSGFADPTAPQVAPSSTAPEAIASTPQSSEPSIVRTRAPEEQDVLARSASDAVSVVHQSAPSDLKSATTFHSDSSSDAPETKSAPFLPDSSFTTNGTASAFSPASGSQHSSGTIQSIESGLGRVITSIAESFGEFRGLQVRWGETINLHGAIESGPIPGLTFELAKLDAGMFRDALRAFAHESAALWTTKGGRSVWTRPTFVAATALMADAILVGVWQVRRKRQGMREIQISIPTGK
jgi:hypothetical protein